MQFAAAVTANSNESPVGIMHAKPAAPGLRQNGVDQFRAGANQCLDWLIGFE